MRERIGCFLEDTKWGWCAARKGGGWLWLVSWLVLTVEEEGILLLFFCKICLD